MNQKNTAIILAGGTGVRMDTVTPKQFLRIAGKPVVVHTLLQFEKSTSISDIVVVSANLYVDDLKKLIKKNKITKVRKVVKGGATRQESSFIGLENCPTGTEFVLIHDAVRPFVDERIIEFTLAAAKEAGASDTVIDTADTIIVKKGSFIKEVPERKNLKRGQTPQAFRYKTILEAHKWALKKKMTNFTDDCGLILATGGKVKLVEGSVFNIKLTDQTDLYLAERLFQLKRENLSISDFRALHGKVAVVVGGTGAIGNEIVALLGKYGCKAVPVSLSSKIKCDIKDEKSVKCCLDRVLREHGEIDILIDSAGVLKMTEVENTKLNEWNELLSVNLTGAFILAKNVIPIFKKKKGAHMVFITSSAYTRGRAGYSAYSASKAALVNFCQALADEVIKYNIYVNVVSPQRVATPMRSRFFQGEESASLLSPYEVAEKVVECCITDETGHVIDVRTQK